jgi:hypothetical protein
MIIVHDELEQFGFAFKHKRIKLDDVTTAINT